MFDIGRAIEFMNAHPDHFTNEEFRHVAQGKCLTQITCGTPSPGSDFCQDEPVTGSLHCPEHRTQLADTDPDAFGLNIIPRSEPFPTRIDTRADLVSLARKLRVRPDWHEPDEQEVTAVVRGGNFDNAGFWPDDRFNNLQGCSELHVIITQTDENDKINSAHAVNLATLLAWATGYDD